MKANQAQVGQIVSWYNDKNRTGIILANRLRQGDECVIVEWDGDSNTCQAQNINDLVLDNKIVDLGGDLNHP